MSSSLNEQDHFNAARKWQEYFDNHLCDIGSSVPPPTLGQTSSEYLRNLCRTAKRTFLPQNHPLYKVQWRDHDSLRSDALQALVPQLMDACKAEAENPNTVHPGEFRQITKRNPYGQIQETRFIGPESFVKAMGRPGRRVRSLAMPKDTHGREQGYVVYDQNASNVIPSASLRVA